MEGGEWQHSYETRPTQKISRTKTSPTIGEFRRMDAYGPVYEVIAIEGSRSIIIRELESQHITRDYPVEFFMSDPKQ